MMKTRNSSDRTGARATRVAASSLLALSALSVGVGSTLAAGGSGSIWTTDADCDQSVAQNQNVYAVGQTIYVRGDGFDASAPLSWSIEGMPGGASGDPGVVVASGSADTDDAGAFCLDLYDVAPDDWGVYSVDVTQGRTVKHDNYRVDGTGDPNDETTDPGDQTTDPGDETTDPGDETTDPGDQTTDPGDETTDPGDETTEPGSETTEPAAETTDGTPEAPASTVAGESSTSGPADSTTGSTGGTTPLSQSVLGAVSTGGSLELPPTDTIAAAVTDGSSIFLILGLAGLAAAAVLFAPIRRREPEATE
jgi:hypothetical protein